jgi:hypothetical protein
MSARSSNSAALPHSGDRTVADLCDDELAYLASGCFEYDDDLVIEVIAEIASRNITLGIAAIVMAFGAGQSLALKLRLIECLQGSPWLGHPDIRAALVTQSEHRMPKEAVKAFLEILSAPVPQGPYDAWSRQADGRVAAGTAHLLNAANRHVARLRAAS